MSLVIFSGFRTISGFRSKLGIDDAIYVTNKIIQALDQKNKCIGIFLDIKKPFDTVHHKILLEKLFLIDIRGNVLKLFESYLNDRYQVTKIANYYSEPCLINVGVPQGTVLGAILFLVYINDLYQIDLSVYNGVVYSYADDTDLHFGGKTWRDTFK